MIEVYRGSEWVSDTPVDGERFRELKDGNVIRESFWRDKALLTEYGTSEEQITINGGTPIDKASVYFSGVDHSITIQSNIVNDALEVQTNIDSSALGYPPILVVPVMKYANKQVVDEVYFQVTINNGVITTSGSLPSAGNWKMTTVRVNDSLSAINAGWKFIDASANFIVS